MYEEVARHAYYAAFHAAQALIFERIGKVSKTHTGTHSLFNSVARSEPALNLEIRSFLKISYDYKTVADYETGASGASEID